MHFSVYNVHDIFLPCQFWEKMVPHPSSRAHLVADNLSLNMTILTRSLLFDLWMDCLLKGLIPPSISVAFLSLKIHKTSLSFSKSFPSLSTIFNVWCPFTLNAPIATNVVCFSRLLKCLRSLYGKQCGPRSDCSYRSSLFWVHAVCFFT